MNKKFFFGLVFVALISLSSCDIFARDSSLNFSSDSSSTSHTDSSHPNTSSGNPSTSTSFPVDEYHDPYRILPQLSSDGESADIYTVSWNGSSYVGEYFDTYYIDEVYVDYEDVALYYLAFETFPVNYFPNNNYGKQEAMEQYGDDGRLWSQYQKGDYTGPNSYTESLGIFNNSRGTYYELDIDADGYYSVYDRRRARLVIVEEGITDYGFMPVVYYTDDHYSTFIEFYNYPGGWSDTFGGTTHYEPERSPAYTVSWGI